MEVRDDGFEARQGTEAEQVWSRKGRWMLPLVGIASLLGFVLASRNWPREHDRHTVASQVRELERRLRSHGPDLWLLVEGGDDRGGGAGLQEARHQAMLRDFERLDGLEGLAMTDVEVQIDGDKALATYRIHASAGPGEGVPRGGQLEFVRRKEGWRVAGHRFVE